MAKDDGKYPRDQPAGSSSVVIDAEKAEAFARAVDTVLKSRFSGVGLVDRATLADLLKALRRQS
jgi:hypothetical protein